MENTWKKYYDNGMLKEEVPMKNGKLNGVGYLYDEEGNLIEKRIYSNDVLMGNPYKGANLEEIAEALGLTEVSSDEWELAEKEEGSLLNVTPEMASILLLK